MAIAGLSAKTGSKGRASAHANYVARTGQYAKYTERGEVLEATSFGNMPTWAASDPAVFWSASDLYERANGTAYRELQIALPRELNPEQRLALVESFVASEIGDIHAYQYAIHVPKAADGLDNPHVHLMFSERRNDGIARDPDQYFKRYNPKHPERGGSRKYFGANPHERTAKSERVDELKALRSRWEMRVNTALEQAGIDERISMKSYSERGLDIEPEIKQLPSEWRAGGREVMIRHREDRAAELAARQEPGAIVERVSLRKAVFTRQDLYRELSKVTEDAALFARIKAQLDVHPAVVELELPESVRGSVSGRAVGSSTQWLTTRQVLDSERSVRALGDSLSGERSFGVSVDWLDKAISAVPFTLSDEQVSAVRHVSDDKRLALVSGVAGAGKSTMLGVVRAGYEAQGYRVSGMALAGKAAAELTQSSGIESRTIASWLYRVDKGDIELSEKDVVVLDEAGMVHNGTMARVLDAVNRAGAKVILVGDAEQLQPIELGVPFLSLSQDHGAAEISAVRRQRDAWQREATQALSQKEGVKALAAYEQAGCVHEGAAVELLPTLVANYLDGGGESKIILAHRKVDVAMINAAVRDERKARGALSESVQFTDELELAVGDRVVFTKNNAPIGVLNGQFGEVVSVAKERVCVARDDGSLVEFSSAQYQDLQHGYASTIHKSQGMTVDRALVWGSASMDRHLGYVAMSRHRERLDVYQSDEATKGRSLADCLKRSSRSRGVDAVIDEYGLGLVEGDDGRARLVAQGPAQEVVDVARVQLDAIRAGVRQAMVSERLVLEDSVRSASAALSAHVENEPSGGKWHLRLKKGAAELRSDWERGQRMLESAVSEARSALRYWERENPSDEMRIIRTIAREASGAKAILAEDSRWREYQVQVRDFDRLEKTLESNPARDVQRQAERELRRVRQALEREKPSGLLAGRLSASKEKVPENTRSRDGHGL